MDYTCDIPLQRPNRWTHYIVFQGEQAWYNACVHNKWAEFNNPGIYVFSDRIEVESHGGIPGFQTKEDFLRGVSKPVNPELFSIFKTVGFGEESGHGVPTVVGVYGREAFFFSKNVIDVTIPFETPNAQNNKRVPLKNSPKKSSDKFFQFP